MSMKNTIKSICPALLLKTIDALKIYYRPIRSIPYRLDAFFFPGKIKRYCPCCGLRFRSFRAGNYINLADKVDVNRYKNIGQDVICPYCGSLPRHRILSMWCEENIGPLQSSKILYFAPEKSMTMWMNRHNIDITTADLYQEADLKLDIQDTALPDSSYDIIFCNHVLEHVDDYKKALKELHRLLKDGGTLICSFPIDTSVDILYEDQDIKTPENRIRHFGQFDHKRIFGVHADKLLEEAGFKVDRINGDRYPEKILPVIGPADYDINILFCCVKG